MVKSIAGEIRRYRKARGMSVQQLADECERLGWPIKRTVLSNLESGYRETITVPELVVLARALAVPAIQLLYPLGIAPTVELLPGVELPTEDAARWFTGWHDPFPAEGHALIGHGEQDAASGLHEWYEKHYADAGAPIHLYAEHRQLVSEHQDAEAEAARRLGQAATTDALRDEAARLRRQVETVLRNKRREMERRGFTVLPELPAGLEHLR